MTIKAIGHQWYWSYEYPDNGNFTFDALTDAGQRDGWSRAASGCSRPTITSSCRSTPTVRMLTTGDGRDPFLGRCRPSA